MIIMIVMIMGNDLCVFFFYDFWFCDLLCFRCYEWDLLCGSPIVGFFMVNAMSFGDCVNFCMLVSCVLLLDVDGWN